ncbi:hypothetical protein BVY04_03770 [bacterium M21]|nr:hypothetical protein BVY04_03770 [bacterium M21]
MKSATSKLKSVFLSAFGIVILMLIPWAADAIPIPTPGLGDLLFGFGPLSLAGWGSLGVMGVATVTVVLHAGLRRKRIPCPDLRSGLLVGQFLFFVTFACVAPLMHGGSCHGTPVTRDLWLVSK